MYGAITLVITYKNVWKNTRRPVKCTAVRARWVVLCMSARKPAAARCPTRYLDLQHTNIATGAVETTHRTTLSFRPSGSQNESSLITLCIQFYHFFYPYVFCCCLKQRPNFFQSERNVVPVNVTSNLHPCYPCWIHITLIMRCLQTCVPCCLCCVIDVVCPTVVLLLHDFCMFYFTVCATTVFRPPKNVVFHHDVVGIPDWFS